MNPFVEKMTIPRLIEYIEAQKKTINDKKTSANNVMSRLKYDTWEAQKLLLSKVSALHASSDTAFWRKEANGASVVVRATKNLGKVQDVWSVLREGMVLVSLADHPVDWYYPSELQILLPKDIMSI